MSDEQIARDADGRLRQDVTSEGVKRFHHAFGGSNAIHTQDPPPGQAQGAGVVQHGMRTLFPVLAKAFAAGAHSVDVSVKFLAPVRAGDVAIFSLGSIEGKSCENSCEDAEKKITVTNGDGVVVAAGTIKYK